MPVRILLSQISELVSDLKPCLMMSPLTVSHFLSPSQQFDLVVFDEASQVPPQDAINCIYRGKQLIVAGDTRQLPPTPFFQVAEARGDVERGCRGSVRGHGEHPRFMRGASRASPAPMALPKPSRRLDRLLERARL